MKKFLALLLALCLVLAAVPVLAESAAEEAAQAVVDETAQEVAEQAAEIIAADEAAAETDEGEPVEPEKESLSTVLSGLLDQVSDTLKDENGLGGVIDRLADDLGRETGLGDLADQLKEGGKQLGGLVAGLNNTLKENGQSLDGLLSLLGSEPVQDGISKAVDEAVAGLSEANLTPEELGSLLKDLLSGGGLGGTEGEAEAAAMLKRAEAYKQYTNEKRHAAMVARTVCDAYWMFCLEKIPEELKEAVEEFNAWFAENRAFFEKVNRDDLREAAVAS